MTDIELVIKISEEDYETLVNTNDSSTPSMIARGNLYKALKNGIPLSKKQELVFDKIRAEIKRWKKLLLCTGYTTYTVNIALDAIKSIIAEKSEDKE